MRKVIFKMFTVEYLIAKFSDSATPAGSSSESVTGIQSSSNDLSNIL